MSAVPDSGDDAVLDDVFTRFCVAAFSPRRRLRLSSRHISAVTLTGCRRVRSGLGSGSLANTEVTQSTMKRANDRKPDYTKSPRRESNFWLVLESEVEATPLGMQQNRLGIRAALLYSCNQRAPPSATLQPNSTFLSLAPSSGRLESSGKGLLLGPYTPLYPSNF